MTRCRALAACCLVLAGVVVGQDVRAQTAAPGDEQALLPTLSYSAPTLFAPFSPMRWWLRTQLQAPLPPPAKISALLAQPLVAMRYVGYLRGSRGAMALLEVDGQVYLVRPGQRVGVEGARVLGVDSQSVAFQLRLQGAAGHAVVLPRLWLRKDKQDGSN